MEDRYLFRGKTATGEWVEGSLLPNNTKDRWFVKKAVSTAIAAEVMPETICQCTGVKDKNGKLIWEHDILSAYIDDEYPENETRAHIVWHENGWYTDEGCADYEELDDFDSENFEVIGNIVDNPELFGESVDMAVNALEEIRQYRAIGTVEECLRNKDLLDFLSDKMAPSDFELYMQIYNSQDKKGGGVE